MIGRGALEPLLALRSRENWELSDDGKATFHKEMITEEELAKEREAAESCPVQVIHIINTETREQIINKHERAEEFGHHAQCCNGRWMGQCFLFCNPFPLRDCGGSKASDEFFPGVKVGDTG